MKRVLSAAVLALSLSLGCSDPVAPHGSVAELQLNRQKWLSKRPADYTYHLVQGGGFGFFGTVHVINGAARVFTNEGTPVAAPWASIEAAFDHAEQSLGRKLDAFEIEYDPMLGYPSRISINPEMQIADDEWAFVVTEFRVSGTKLP